MKASLSIGVGLVLLAALGVPVGSYAVLVAVPCLALGGLAAIAGADAVSRPLFAVGIGSVIAGILLSGLGGAMRVCVDSDDTQLAIAVAVGLVVLAGAGALAVKMFGALAARPKSPKLPVRERADVIARPVPAPTTTRPTAPASSSRAAPVARAPSADELGIFRRKPQ